MQDDTNWSSLSIVSCSSQRSTCDHEILEEKVHLVLEVLNKGQQTAWQVQKLPSFTIGQEFGKRNLTQPLHIWDIFKEQQPKKKKKRKGKRGRKESRRKYTTTLWCNTITWVCAEVCTKGFYIILTGKWVDTAILTHNLGSRGLERSNDLKTWNHKAKLPWWLRW